MAESGQLNRFNKNKGYESIPRDFLQSNELSLEAIGFLCNIQSYPEEWVLYKTELYKRYPKNKRSSIERIWAELMEHGYIVQYRKRDGKRYVYQYYFSLVKFNNDDLKEIDEIMSLAGYSFYTKESKVKTESKTDEIDRQTDKTKNTDMGISDNDKIWDVENQQSNENADKSTFFGMLNLNSSKPTANRFTIKDFEDDDEYNIIKENQKNETIEFDISDENLKLVGRYLASSGVGYEDMVKILNAMSANNKLLDPKMIVQQMNWCIEKNSKDGIGDFAKYFINGLERKTESDMMNKNSKFESEFLASMSSKNGDDKPVVPLTNWLEQ